MIGIKNSTDKSIVFETSDGVSSLIQILPPSASIEVNGSTEIVLRDTAQTTQTKIRRKRKTRVAPASAPAPAAASPAPAISSRRSEAQKKAKLHAKTHDYVAYGREYAKIPESKRPEKDEFLRQKLGYFPLQYQKDRFARAVKEASA